MAKEQSCNKCIHYRICKLWREAECQDASCYSDRCFKPKQNYVNWISVEKKLPPRDVLVIGAIYTTDIIHLKDGESVEDGIRRTNREAEKHPHTEPCWYGNDGSGDSNADGWYGYEGFPMVCHPRYWMPIPKPPEVTYEE